MPLWWWNGCKNSWSIYHFVWTGLNLYDSDNTTWKWEILHNRVCQGTESQLPMGRRQVSCHCLFYIKVKKFMHVFNNSNFILFILSTQFHLWQSLKTEQVGHILRKMVLTYIFMIFDLTPLPAQISASNFHDLTQITQRRVRFNPKRSVFPCALV